MDPNYAVLLEDNEELSSGCGDKEEENKSNRVNRNLVAIIVPVVVGVVVLAIVLAFLIPKYGFIFYVSVSI